MEDFAQKQHHHEEQVSLRSLYHFTVPQQWLNDPQRPFYVGDECHLYYLYSSSYYLPGEWRHIVTKDYVTFEDRGIAIPMHDDMGVWSGSCVVDTDNTAGFAADSVIVLATQPTGGDDFQQEQYLWYSRDQGNSFIRLDQAVIPNPNRSNWFRDPKIVWDGEHQRWIAAIASDHSIILYDSENLKEWHHLSTFTYDVGNLGGIECPDLFTMVADDGTSHWIIAGSVRGVPGGKTNTYAYWVGKFDGDEFIPDHQMPQWLDDGWDWYAAVTWAKTDATMRYAIGWMNNWEYAARTVPTDVTDHFDGMLSLVRTLKLANNPEGYSLLSQPVETLNRFFKKELSVENIAVHTDQKLSFAGRAYRIDADIRRADAEVASIRVGVSPDQRRYLEFGIDNNGFFMDRSHCERDDYPFHPSTLSRSEISQSAENVHITAFVDMQSVEVFVADGKHVHSDQIYFLDGDNDVWLHAQEGTAVFANLEIATLQEDHPEYEHSLLEGR